MRVFYIIEILFIWHNKRQSRQEPSLLSGKRVTLAPQRKKCVYDALLEFAMDIYIVIIKYIIQRSLNILWGKKI